ncbi:hypothetical protein OIU78_006825 [Salix suchowensis]|nr:hypothetical protein OIU78_006825 [Salix suchowensis]
MKCNSHILFSLIVLYASLNRIPVASRYYKSESDSYVLACGASGAGTDSDGRNWQSDAKYINSLSSSTAATAQNQDSSLPSTIPYMTARIFSSESTYKFSVPKKGRLWVRLHFYPSTYSSLDPNTSYFSVTANTFTLLKNFSASITAHALTQAYIVREFSLIPDDSGILNLTFTPSSNYNNAYAFVNGIEVIPMPDIYQPAALVGFSDQTLDVGSSTLQTMFRLNAAASPLKLTLAFNTPTENLPKSIAPLDVYSTARSMGTRFHFCEYQETRVNQRVFNIYLNNQTAQEGADVIGWAGSQGVPIYKDYAVYVGDRSGDEELWVALHPSVSMKPEYYDAILNGLEIFKLNDSRGNLAGPNPVPSLMMLQAEAKKGFSPSGSGFVPVIGGILGGSAGIAVLALISIFVYRKTRCDCGNQYGSSANWLPLYGHSHTSASGSTISEQGVNEFQTEIEMLSKLRHKHLVSLIGFCEEDGEMVLVYNYMANGTLREHLYKGNNPALSWKQRLEISEKCLADHGYNRPSMGDVLWNLEFSLQFQDNPVEDGLIADSTTKDTDANHREIAGTEDTGREGTDEPYSSEIFSQLVNPKGK